MDVQASPRSRLRPLRVARISTVNQPPMPLPAGGGGNGDIYARSKQLALGTTSHRPAVAARGPLRVVETEAGKNRPGLGTSDAFAIPGLPTDPRISGGLLSEASPAIPARPAGDEPAVAVSDAVESEGEPHVADGPPLAQGRIRVPEDQRRGPGRQSALRPRFIHRQLTIRPVRRQTTSTTSPTSCSGSARSTPSARVRRKDAPARCTSRTCRTTCA